MQRLFFFYKQNTFHCFLHCNSCQLLFLPNRFLYGLSRFSKEQFVLKRRHANSSAATRVHLDFNCCSLICSFMWFIWLFHYTVSLNTTWTSISTAAADAFKDTVLNSKSVMKTLRMKEKSVPPTTMKVNLAVSQNNLAKTCSKKQSSILSLQHNKQILKQQQSRWVEKKEFLVSCGRRQWSGLVFRTFINK